MEESTPACLESASKRFGNVIALRDVSLHVNSQFKCCRLLCTTRQCGCRPITLDNLHLAQLGWGRGA